MTDPTPDIHRNCPDTLTLSVGETAALHFKITGDLVVRIAGDTGSSSAVTGAQHLRSSLSDDEIDGLLHHLHEVLAFRRWNDEQDRVTDDDLVNVGRIEERREQREAEVKQKVKEVAGRDPRNEPRIVVQSALAQAVQEMVSEGYSAEIIREAVDGLSKMVPYPERHETE